MTINCLNVTGVTGNVTGMYYKKPLKNNNVTGVTGVTGAMRARARKNIIYSIYKNITLTRQFIPVTPVTPVTSLNIKEKKENISVTQPVTPVTF